MCHGPATPESHRARDRQEKHAPPDPQVSTLATLEALCETAATARRRPKQGVAARVWS